MPTRMTLAGLLVAVTTLGLAATVPAQTPARKVVEITMTSYKFEPSQVRINEDDAIIIRLKNADPTGRRHNFSSAYLLNIPVTVRGDGEEGTNEGRRFVAVEAGKQAEFEFVAKGRGSFAFICSVLNHAILGQTGVLTVAAPGQ
ncbi:MAG: hypothetical protein A2Z07_03705 [Armatimonadetes bacterium RBG_16_67_12]|nr:MAG: hypothetical protein A2Z07_03705 [Armatimonadetes bacterium RBG_16_67_12]